MYGKQQIILVFIKKKDLPSKMLVGRLCALNAKLKTDLTGNQVPSNRTTDLQIKKGRA